MEEVRIDKYLWSVRLYKTRNLAIEACRAGKVKMDGSSVKPSRIVKEGDVINLTIGQLNKTIKVKQLLHNRISAKLVTEYLDDLTPPEEYERIEFMRQFKAEQREKGTGRPTKKERRHIDKLKGDL